MAVALVAGAAGLLGSAVARRLLDEGVFVVAAELFDESGDGRAVKEARAKALQAHIRAENLVLQRADLTEPAAVEALFAEHRPSLVLNAARFAVPGSGVAALVDAAKASGTGLLVHLSDSALYGPAPEAGRRAREDEPLAPEGNPYLEARAVDEGLIRDAGLPFVILRVFELVGPGLPPSRFPSQELEAILGGEDVFLPDDEPRDFLDLDDAVRGVLLVRDRRPLGETLNLGSGGAIRPRDFLESLAHHAGRTANITGTAGTPLLRPARIADMEKAWSLLGFAPRRGLDEIADEIVWTRLQPPGTVPRGGERRRPAPSGRRPEPRPVSRRELFGLFRRPFDAKR